MRIGAINFLNFSSHAIKPQEKARLKSAIDNKQAVLYDVDTTHGFMDQDIFIRPDGTRDGFPVSGADRIIPALQKITTIANGKIPKFETVDAHTFADPEMKLFEDISDIHSEKGTFGAEKIKETIFKKPDYTIEVEPEKDDVPNDYQIQDFLNSNGVIRLEKNETSPLRYGDAKSQTVIGNKKAMDFFQKLHNAGVKTALVYGVATDYCVSDATQACKDFGITPVIIEDAVKEAQKNTLLDEDDRVYGDVAVITTDELRELLED